MCYKLYELALSSVVTTLDNATDNTVQHHTFRMTSTDKDKEAITSQKI